MNLRELRQLPLGHKRRKRVGRGTGSGHGKTCTRGNKGAMARTGAGGLVGYEGGQTPLFRRLPKRGFSNARFRLEYAIVNVGDLQDLPPGTEVTPELLCERRKIRKIGDGLKVLGGGDLTVPLTVHAHRFSRTAVEKIEKAGGKIKRL